MHILYQICGFQDVPLAWKLSYDGTVLEFDLGTDFSQVWGNFYL